MKGKSLIIYSRFNFLKFILFFATTTFYSQQKSTVKGIVLTSNKPYPNVNVQNLTSKKIVVTDGKGDFIIEANPKDTLLFTSIQLIDLKLVLSPKDFEATKLEVVMVEKNTLLKEVIVTKHPNIDAVSLGIIPKKIKKLTHAERKLITAGDFKPIHLLALLGGSLEVDPILNAINGRTKKLKREIEIEKKEANLLLLENKFYNYLKKDLQLSDNTIKKIFYLAIEDKNIQVLIQNKEDEKLKFSLLDYANTVQADQ